MLRTGALVPATGWLKHGVITTLKMLPGAALLLAWAMGAVAEVPAGKVELSPCTLPDLKVQARCGVYFVPENPARADSRKIPIHIAVVPAKGSPRRDPIVPLMGGPGEDAIG